MPTRQPASMNPTQRLSNPSSLDPRAAIWTDLAPETIGLAYCSGSDPAGWKAWAEHLHKRSRPQPLVRLLNSRRSPLSWCVPACTTLVVPGRGQVLELLNEAHALPRLAATSDSDSWWATAERLLIRTRHAPRDGVPHVRRGGFPHAERDEYASDDPFVRQLALGELPLTLAYLFPEIEPCRQLAEGASRVLGAGLIDLLDGEGLPHGQHCDLVRPLLACWTRCRAMGIEVPGGAWSEEAQEQYRWLVRNALRLMRADGSHVFSRGPAATRCDEMFRSAVQFSEDEEARGIAAATLPAARKASPSARGKRTGGRTARGKNGRNGKKAKALTLPEAATHSEWACAAVLRPGWSRSEPQLTVLYPQAVHLEFCCGPQLFWSGTWDMEIRCDGRPVLPPAEWEEVCWVSDENVDYLELEADLGGDLRVERHLLLARKDRLLLLADSLLASRPMKLEYRGILPLCDGVALESDGETREGFLRAGKKRHALVLPLGLPEWRKEPHAGGLEHTDRGLELRQEVEGRAMFAPLFFDLQTKRLARPLTWRPLTVAENLAAVPRDVAVGYRVMIGKDQWLIYRSLGPRGNRTLLGHNLVSEMLVAQFDNGEVKTLLEIE